MAIKIDTAVFCHRLAKLYKSWEEDLDMWHNATTLTFIVGSQSERHEIRYLKSIAVQLWFFSYEIPDTIMVFTKKELHILTSQKKADILKDITDATKKALNIGVVFHIRPKKESGQRQVKELMSCVSKQGGKGPIGKLKDEHEGQLYSEWSQALEKSKTGTVEVGYAVGRLLALKEDDEIISMKKAAFLAAGIMQNFVLKQLERAIEDDSSITHATLSRMTLEAIADPNAKAQVRLHPDNCYYAYEPVFQSGGAYDLRPGCAPDDTPLHNGIIFVSLGTKYSGYCANIARTVFIDQGARVKEQYEILQEAQRAAIEALRPGTQMQAAYEAVLALFDAKGRPEFAQKLTKNVGFGIGLEFKDGTMTLKRGNANVVGAGMTFNVAVGLQGLENPEATDEKLKTYSMMLADTVLIKSSGPEVLNSAGAKECSSDWLSVAYQLNDSEEEIDEEEELKFEAAELLNDHVENGKLDKARRRKDTSTKDTEEAKRREKQLKLQEKLNRATYERMTEKKGQQDDTKGPATGRSIADIMAYRSSGDMPRITQHVIQVDQEHACVLVPIYGIMVPFHVTTIRNVSYSQDGEHASVRLNFNYSAQYEPAQKFPHLVFLKELSYRTTDLRHASRVVQEIKTVRQHVIAQDKERAERATLVQQEKLRMGKRVYRLPDLWIRPPIGGKGKKMPGALECHANGFRYQTGKSSETLDIMFRNIKHAFFQPAQNEMITLLHFHLHNPIMAGKKKTVDVQVYAEVMEVVQTLDGGRRQMYDPDELQEEQRERERRNKVNSDFQQFVKRVSEFWEKEYRDLQLEFDMPFRELGFSGVPFKSTVFVMPSVNCLVELIEMPFLVVTLNDIELVNLERVGFNLKNFDMAIVFKEFQRDVLRIDAIPAAQLEDVKSWLNRVSIKYYESKMNLMWKPILKSIMEDPETFLEQGGWDFLDVDKSDDEDLVEEASEEFQPESGDDDEESEEASEDESLVDSEEDDEGGSEEGSEEEEGMSWDELHKQAAEQDEENMSDESEGERYRKRKQPQGGGGGKKARR